VPNFAGPRFALAGSSRRRRRPALSDIGVSYLRESFQILIARTFFMIRRSEALSALESVGLLIRFFLAIPEITSADEVCQL